MRLATVTAEEVIKIVGSMPNKTSSGYDDLPINFLRNHCLLFSVSVLMTAFFRNSLKLKVIPLHKKGSQTDIKKYRPISVLPTISKIFEK